MSSFFPPSNPGIPLSRHRKKIKKIAEGQWCLISVANNVQYPPLLRSQLLRRFFADTSGADELFEVKERAKELKQLVKKGMKAVGETCKKTWHKVRHIRG
ncbi:hypothetical protein C4D60_Mb04t33330 [Musa balbisiana]|uniref:Uncharacterized protein n=1 Tax=Musa balbisiana TaxID=52838 RepID=A0A4S8KGG0_MUSBA|nr:hypothetical protein C4D60_Mb04t33330 [Musa balbisiana]